MYIPSSKWTWAFTGVAIAQAVLCLALEAYIFGQFQHQLVPAARDPSAANNAQYAKAVPTDLALLIFAFIYELVLVYDALRSQNTIQIIGICMMNFGILIYTGIQIDEVHTAVDMLSSLHFLSFTFWDQIRGYLVALPCLVCLGTTFMTFLAWKLYEEFGWSIYKQIGADLRMKRCYLLYQIYIAILKFDFFLFVGFIVQFLVIVPNTQQSEFWVTVAAMPIIILLLILAAVSAQREYKISTGVSVFVYVCALAYFLFKLVRMYSTARAKDYEPARKTLTVFAVITIILLVVTIVIAIRCALNYGKGLKNHILRTITTAESPVSGKESYYENSYNMAPQGYGPRPAGGTRMEID